MIDDCLHVLHELHDRIGRALAELAPLPESIERDVRIPVVTETTFDPELLKPPRLPWENGAA